MVTNKVTPDKEEDLKELLHPIVKKWFFSKFKEFSLPQLFGVMEIHKRNNVLVSAPTGATKTLTGFLSILNELIDSSEKGVLKDKVYCVYISPLKALSNDISFNLVTPLKEMEELAGKDFGIRISVRTGDTTQAEKSKMLKRPPHILITTPESLAILLSSSRFTQHLSDVDWCIVDEIHALAENKRGVHLSLSLERLSRLCPYITRIGLSATIHPLDEVARFLVGCEKGKEMPCKIVDVQFIKKLDLKVLSPVNDLINITHAQLHHKMYELLDEIIQKHKTTLIFTNTRSATERVVHYLKDKFPKNYTENIGAHHGSLSKELRLELEQRMREGNLKVVVSSTSLELGIDIGYIDLVVLLSSPKSVARALQRTGRSGHRLHDTTKGRLVVMDRDDLIECSLILKHALEKKIDNIHIPTNCLDVLAQQIFGIAVSEQMHIDTIYETVKGSYCYKDLKKQEFIEVIEYLAGMFTSLEDRHVYAKIWYDETTGMIGRKGKLARVLYMTNIGTIPDETFVKVKVGDVTIGQIDEGFLERLKRGDIFVLGGQVYEFLFSRGMVAQVRASPSRPPTIPAWYSDMLPLSFDLAMGIQRFRKLISQKFENKRSEKEVLEFINEHLYVDGQTAEAVYNYCKDQHDYIGIPHEGKIIIENYTDDAEKRVTVFHTLYGRRVNDVLSRAVAFAISRSQHRDVQVGITDNGFYVSCDKTIQPLAAFKLLKSKELRQLMSLAIERSEVLKRRFRHCATRALMILREYKGHKKRVGRQQVSSMLLLNAVRSISENFSILKEARREVLEDLMDIDNAVKVLELVEEGKIKVSEAETRIPSPFGLNLIVEGRADVMKADSKQEFLKRMHNLLRAKLAVKKY
ncbi:ATP-dependent helicase [Candidatus Woesearchaeota archaeon]|nr:ATP-dependent helicase [Candidatus Woesearchaeota archaeon]